MNLREVQNQIYQTGFNIYACINRFKNLAKLREDLPEEVYVNACQQFLKVIQSKKIKHKFPYFVALMKQASSAHFSAKNEREGKELKRTGMTEQIKNLIQSIGVHHGI